MKLTKNIYVDIEADVEVTLSVSEIKDFFDQCSEEEKEGLRGALRVNNFNSSTVLGQMKLEILAEAFKKYTLDQLEEKLK